jgi:quinolinate synthase
MMTNVQELQQKVRRLLKTRKAILLAHYYQRDEIQEIADFLGDSLALSMEAARTDAEVIVFVGVHFMAESAAIISPDRTVLLPRPDAGCALADGITAEQLKKVREADPELMVVTYINSSAAVKALSDICCTSANAVRVVNSLPGGKRVLMAPDGNLARYTAHHTDREIIPWEGCCPVHQDLSVAEVQRVKETWPGAPFLAHPECNPAVLAEADFVGSTTAILRFARESIAETIIIGTERGIFYSLKKESPGKRFVPASNGLLCETMKYTTLDDIITALETMTPVITVPEAVGAPAKRALDRMLALG